jgi:hypothetical protein
VLTVASRLRSDNGTRALRENSDMPRVVTHSAGPGTHHPCRSPWFSRGSCQWRIALQQWVKLDMTRDSTVSLCVSIMEPYRSNE